jgi:hypothetical protein
MQGRPPAKRSSNQHPFALHIHNVGTEDVAQGLDCRDTTKVVKERAEAPLQTPNNVRKPPACHDERSVHHSEEIRFSSNPFAQLKEMAATCSEKQSPTIAMRPFHVSADFVQPHSHTATGAGSSLRSVSYVANNSSTLPNGTKACKENSDQQST